MAATSELQVVPEFWSDSEGEEYSVACEGVTQEEAALAVLGVFGEGAFEFESRHIVKCWDCEDCAWSSVDDSEPHCSEHPAGLPPREVECYVFQYFLDPPDGPDDERSDYYIAGHTAMEPKPWQPKPEPEPEPIPVCPGQVEAFAEPVQ